VRSEVKRLLEEALEAERTDWLGVGRYVRDEGGGGIIATGITGGTWGRASGCLRRLRVPRTRRGCRSQLLPLSTAAILTRSDFHEVSRAVGPK
jgi:hypothetical protein